MISLQNLATLTKRILAPASNDIRLPYLDSALENWQAVSQRRRKMRGATAIYTAHEQTTF
jgi:hypothetical protein